MNLHLEPKIFKDAIEATSQHLQIKPSFVEKDYWVSLILKRLADSEFSNRVVFKGGTSLSKGHKLIDRFSEDIDIAVLDTKGLNSNQVKSLIRAVDKTISIDLEEIKNDKRTRKFSRYRKSIYRYPQILDSRLLFGMSDTMLIEVNSFANPYPSDKIEIYSMIYSYLAQTAQLKMIEQYKLQGVNVLVLDKYRTFLEKIANLLRFSYDEDPIKSIAGKIRHFYDLYYIYKTDGSKEFLASESFNKGLADIIDHDKDSFDEPAGWNYKTIIESPLISNFENIWSSIKGTYQTELSGLTYREIPDENDIYSIFVKIIEEIKKGIK